MCQCPRVDIVDPYEEGGTYIEDDSCGAEDLPPTEEGGIDIVPMPPGRHSRPLRRGDGKYIEDDSCGAEDLPPTEEDGIDIVSMPPGRHSRPLRRGDGKYIEDDSCGAEDLMRPLVCPLQKRMGYGIPSI